MSNEARAYKSFGEEPAAIASHHVAASGKQARRSGIIPLCIDASRMIYGRDGSRRQYKARELRIEAARAERDGRTLNVSVRCFETRREYPTFEAFAADCPTSELMTTHNMSFTWAYWCEDKYDAKSIENIEALGNEIKMLKAAHKARVAEISQQKDVEAMMKLRDLAEKIKAMINEAEAKKTYEEQNIIGLLSDTPYG